MKQTIKNFLKSMGLILLLITFTSFILGFFNVNINTISKEEYMLYSLLSNILLLFIFTLIYFNTLKKDLSNFKKNIKYYLKISFKYWFIGFIIMLTSNFIINLILNKDLASNEIEVRSLFNLFPLFMAFNTVIYAPITEELTFRKSIRDFISNKYLYILISGLLFGYMHIVTDIHSISDLVYLVPYSSLGISFAYTYYKTNNIFSTITIHAFHNFLAIIILAIGGLL